MSFVAAKRFIKIILDNNSPLMSKNITTRIAEIRGHSIEGSSRRIDNAGKAIANASPPQKQSTSDQSSTKCHICFKPILLENEDKGFFGSKKRMCERCSPMSYLIPTKRHVRL